MNKPLSEIENILIDYFKSLRMKTIGNSQERYTISAQAFELETLLLRLKKEYNVNENLDANIHSENILKSFDNIHPNQFHRPVAYQYPYLIWLLNNFDQKKSLHQHIDSFIESIAHLLNYPDIKITKTGATRCKTNVRMAIMNLRSYGILLNKNEKGKQTHDLSSYGLLIAAYLKMREANETSRFGDKNATLTEAGCMTNFCIDIRIFDAIQKMQKKKGFEEIWVSLQLSAFSLQEKIKYNKLWCEYAEMVVDNLDYSDLGIKEKTKENKVIAKFIFQLEKKTDFLKLRKILLDRIRNLD